MKKIVLLLVLILGLLSLNNTAKAAPTEVNTVAELKSAVENSPTDVSVKLGSSFPKDESFQIDIRHPNVVVIDAANIKMSSKIKINMYEPRDTELQKIKLELYNFHFDGEKKHAVGFEFQRMKESSTKRMTEVLIRNAVFENSIDSVINAYSERFGVEEFTTRYIIDRTIVRNNISKNGGAILGKDYVDFTIQKTTVENNENQSNEVGGGAVTNRGVHGKIIFDESRIMNNKLTGVSSGAKKIGGGAIYNEDIVGGFTRVSESYVYGNKTNPNDPQNGGAVYLDRSDKGFNSKTIAIYNSVFAHNESSGTGGAIAYDMTNSEMAHIEIVRSEFYKNKAFGEGKFEGGGALSIYSDDKITKFYKLRYENISFYGNEAKNASGLTKGGAIKFENIAFETPLKRTVFGANIGEGNYENVFSTDGSFNETDTLGVDNGSAPNRTTEDIFGKYPVTLNENRGNRIVGFPNDQYIMPTFSVIPKFTNDADEIQLGFADPLNNIAPIPAYDKDLRGSDLSDYLTMGAVNNASIIYDSNGGDFNLPQLTEFTGEEYYEGTSPTQYGALWLSRKAAKVVHGKEDLNIERKGHTFAGWSTERNGELAAGKQPGDSFTIEGQVKLFAVWKVNKYQTKYYGNGHTSGVAPKMTAAVYEATEKVKDENSLKRTGYTFIGWSEKATATKADLQPGMDYKVGMKNNFYAIWKRDSIEVKFAANKATSGKAPKSAKVLYGNSVKLKNAGTMKRKGYTFTGWSTNKKATKAKYKVGKTVKITKPTTLYAVWKKK